MKHHYENSELGKIFRGKLDAHEAPYNPAHWQQLQAKMKAEQGGAVSFAKWWRYAAVLLLGTSFVASVWWVTQNNAPVVVEKPMPLALITPAPATEINNQPTTPLHNATEPTIASTNENIDNAEKNKNQAIAKVATASNSQKQLPTARTSKSNVALVAKNVEKSVTKPLAISPANEHHVTQQSVASIEKLELKSLSPLGFIQFDDTLKTKGKVIPLQQLPATMPNEPALVRNNLNNFGNFHVGLVAMPYLQWSNVYNAQNQQFDAVDKKIVGLQGGLNVGMSINNWLSIETGVWLNKYEISNFYAQPLPFKLVYGDSLAAKYLFENNNKEVVNYQQTSLLMPISLRVDVLAHEQHRVFVKGTLLNQFIVNESSMYELSYSQFSLFPYTQVERKAFVRGEMSNSSEMIWASAVQLQFGYERKLGEHFGIQVEPFLRLPLKTEGMNQLNNYSTGLALQMNYRF